jgi:TRAP-type C4-dicarboxylate transport system permease small subunit
MLQLLELVFGLFLCFAGFNLIYEAWQEGLELISFFAVGLSLFLFTGGVAISVLAIRRMRNNEKQ